MEGKLKEKLESIGLAFLCLSTGHLSPFNHWCKLKKFLLLYFLIKIFSIFLAGISGIICFALTILLAYASLTKKLEARETKKEGKKTVTIDLPSKTLSSVQKIIGFINTFISSTDTKSCTQAMTLEFSEREVSFLNLCQCIFY